MNVAIILDKSQDTRTFTEERAFFSTISIFSMNPGSLRTEHCLNTHQSQCLTDEEHLSLSSGLSLIANFLSINEVKGLMYETQAEDTGR